MNVIQHGVRTTKQQQKKRKKKLTKRIGIMVQNGGEIGIVESAQCDRLQRPTLGGGIVNVDRRWVGSVRIENVDGVFKLRPRRKC
jgi:hypothetical protein